MLLNKSVRGNCMCYNQKKKQVVISDLKMQINLRIFVSGCELLVSTKENSDRKKTIVKFLHSSSIYI